MPGESLANGSIKDNNRKISGELFTQLLQQEMGYVLACVGIDIQVRMLELSCFIEYSTSSLKEILLHVLKNLYIMQFDRLKRMDYKISL